MASAARKQAEEALTAWEVESERAHSARRQAALYACVKALRALLAEQPCEHRYASADVPAACAPPDSSEVYLDPPLRCGTFAEQPEAGATGETWPERHTRRLREACGRPEDWKPCASPEWLETMVSAPGWVCQSCGHGPEHPVHHGAKKPLGFPAPSPARDEVREAAEEWAAAEAEYDAVPAYSRDTDAFGRNMFRRQSARRRLLAALSSARSAAPARDEVREAAEALRATHAEIARLDERDVASSYTALRALLPRALRDGKALLAALPRDAKGGE